MTSLSTRASLALGLLVGFACAHHETLPAAPPAPAPGSAVTSEDLERQPGRPIEESLMNRFPGVTVTRTPDGGVAVRIRGTTSLMASNEPLYVLDGVEISPGPNGSLAGINPYDIASIEVIKDPAGEAMYGVRGANGVIVIKTKQPGQ